jgi:hypothetical protein
MSGIPKHNAWKEEDKVLIIHNYTSCQQVYLAQNRMALGDAARLGLEENWISVMSQTKVTAHLPGHYFVRKH